MSETHNIAVRTNGQENSRRTSSISFPPPTLAHALELSDEQWAFIRALLDADPEITIGIIVSEALLQYADSLRDIDPDTTFRPADDDSDNGDDGAPEPWKSRAHCAVLTPPLAGRALTPRQAEILQFIEETQAGLNRRPTVREIGSRFGIRSPNGVQSHLKAIAAKGHDTRMLASTMEGGVA